MKFLKAFLGKQGIFTSSESANLLCQLYHPIKQNYCYLAIYMAFQEKMKHLCLYVVSLTTVLRQKPWYLQKPSIKLGK